MRSIIIVIASLLSASTLAQERAADPTRERDSVAWLLTVCEQAKLPSAQSTISALQSQLSEARKQIEELKKAKEEAK